MEAHLIYDSETEIPGSNPLSSMYNEPIGRSDLPTDIKEGMTTSPDEVKFQTM